MRIALLGGTGNKGKGLALRWAPKHDVIIGSRSAEKAEEAAAFCEELLSEEGTTCTLSGEENVEAIADCDVAVFALQYQHAMPTAVTINGNLDPSAIVVSPIVPIAKNGFCAMNPPTNREAPHWRYIVFFQTTRSYRRFTQHQLRV